MSKSFIGRTFSEIVQEQAGRDPAVAGALLEEAVECLLAGDLPTARSLIRDVIKGSMGYAELSRSTGTPEKSPARIYQLGQLVRRKGITVARAAKRIGISRATAFRALALHDEFGLRVLGEIKNG